MTTSGTATARRTHAGARAVAHDVRMRNARSLSLSLSCSLSRQRAVCDGERCAVLRIDGESSVLAREFCEP